MASVNTNNAKRAEMVELMAAVLSHHTKAQVAVLAGITVGAVGAWARGKSMGTNAQRAMLARCDTPEGFAAEARAEAAAISAALEKDPDAVNLARRTQWAAESLARCRQNMAELQSPTCTVVDKEIDIRNCQNAINWRTQELAELPATVAAERAKSRARIAALLAMAGE